MPSKYGLIRPHGLSNPLAPNIVLRWNFCVFPGGERRHRYLLIRILCFMYSGPAVLRCNYQNLHMAADNHQCRSRGRGILFFTQRPQREALHRQPTKATY